jgi:hypothetical protein
MVDANEVPQCVINDEVRKYEPTLEDTFFIIPSGDYQRLIFFNMELREKEQNHLKDFDDFLKQKSLSIPEGFENEQKMTLRFLQKKHWDYQKTHEAILENHQWRQSVNTTDLSKVEAQL